MSRTNKDAAFRRAIQRSRRAQYALEAAITEVFLPGRFIVYQWGSSQRLAEVLAVAGERIQVRHHNKRTLWIGYWLAEIAIPRGERKPR